MRKLDPKVVEKVMLKAGVQPLEPYKTIDTPWKCKCLKCGHEVSPTYGSIKNGQGSCEYCAGTKIDPLEAISVMHENNLKPLEPFKKSVSKWKCECLKCGDIVYPRYNSIASGQGGCIKCGLVAIAESQKYTHEEAYEIMMKAGCEPLETYISSDTSWNCKCLKCDNNISPTLHNIIQGAGGCLFCVKGGFKHDDLAYLYIIFHNQLNSIKVGIGNYDRRIDRIQSFLKEGWQLFKKYDFKKGNDAWKIETKLLRWLRKDLKLPIYLQLEQMEKTGGHTETVSADSITLLEIEEKVEEFKKGLQE